MSKLYLITGNDIQVREKVYCHILQWSQTQQIQPLQPYPALKHAPASETEAETQQTPNFYLYNYLGQGDKEGLAQLTEQYGDDAVESIYLRAPAEEETALLQQNIYQSYDPYRNLAQCLQEIVETVFTGYKKITYDFAAVLQAEAMQERAAQAAAQEAAQQAERAAEQTANRTNTKMQTVFQYLKKMAIPAAILVAWVLVVCLVTIGIFQGVNSRTPKKQEGKIIPVTKGTMSTATPKPKASTTTTPTTTAPTPTPAPESQPDDAMGTLSLAELAEGQWLDFAEPMEGYQLDIFGPVLRNGKYGYCVSYGSPDEAYFILCTDSDTEGDFCAQSTDGTKGVVLADSVLWYMDEKSIHTVARPISHCAISADGNYLFYIAYDGLFCIDQQQGTVAQLLYFPTEESVATDDNTLTPPAPNTLIASPNGEYCAYLTNGLVTLFNRSTKESQYLSTAFQSIQAVDNAGKWVFGTVTRGENQYFARAAVDGSRTDLLTEDITAPCYLSYSGNEVLCQQYETLWLCDANGERTQLPLTFQKEWEFFKEADNILYAPAENTYMCDTLATGYIQLGEERYQLRNNQLQEDLLWMGEKEIPANVLDAIDKVLCFDANGGLLYLDDSKGLYYYSAANQANPQLVMDFTNMMTYAATKDGSALYYFASDGTVGVSRILYETGNQKKGYYSNTVLHKFDFISARGVFEEKNNGMYFYYHSATSSFSFAELYFLTEPVCTYVGKNSNFP